MDGVSLALLVSGAFAAGLVGGGAVAWGANRFGFGKKHRQNATAEREVSAQSSQSVSHSEEGFQVLGKMGYYLASNDEISTPAFSASPMQDVDPQDLA